MTRRCDWCGAEIKTPRSNQRFCSGARCRQKAWDATHLRVTAADAGLDWVRITLDYDARTGRAIVHALEPLP